ncbi:ervatamin-B-like [Ipomoea triloba]|uniref:ervatamin-B-like n=1 Tax=Ipomoea triloba TaxID=35885 RepID=UPI00125D1238|nr:ervatamin-B-like [Ipomoea triloba]
MAHHARSYKDDVEKANRFKIFKQNLEFIESFNKAGNHSYKLGLNKFSDMSPKEFKATMLTDENNIVHPATKFPKGNSLGNNESTVIDPPNSVNWVERGAVTAIRDQLKCGACWAFSTVAAVEGITQIKTGRLVPLSEQQLMDCDETNNGCGGGWPTKAFQYVQEANGLMSESDYPYKGYKQATCATTGGYAAATITGFDQVEQGEDALLQAVTNQPVSTVISLDGYVLQHYESGVFATDCGSGASHAITVVGYGATMEGDKYWLVKNSWGTTWGENGYIKMVRDVVEGGLCGLAKMASYPTID